MRRDTPPSNLSRSCSQWYKGSWKPPTSMNLRVPNYRFGISWLAFGYTLSLHVLDEAAHDFLAVYNPNAMALRRALPILPVPVFSFRSWVASLLCGLTVWLALAPLAFRGARWQRWLAVPVAVLAGIVNGLAHLISSIYLHRLMPGVYSAPLILLAGVVLLRSAIAPERDIAP